MEQSRRLRSGIAELEAQFHGGQLGRRPGEQHITVAHGMQRAGATKGAADLVTRDGFADMMHHDERGPRSIAQTQQRLAQRRHGARVVFVLIVSGVKRVQDDDLGGGGLRGGEKVIHPLGRAEQMAGRAGIDQKILIRGRPYSFPHDRQAVDKLRDRKFELTDEDTARRRDGESGAMRAGRQRQGEVGDQQRLAHFGFSTDKQNPLRRQQSGLHQAGRRSGWLLLQKLGQRQHRGEPRISCRS